MATVARFPPGNRILAALSPSDFELLAPQLTPVVLRLRQDLEEPNKRIGGVYFRKAGSHPSLRFIPTPRASRSGW
jgi:hypothetical protein